jgi:hypothetical protein
VACVSLGGILLHIHSVARVGVLKTRKRETREHEFVQRYRLGQAGGLHGHINYLSSLTVRRPILTVYVPIGHFPRLPRPPRLQ